MMLYLQEKTIDKGLSQARSPQYDLQDHRYTLKRDLGTVRTAQAILSAIMRTIHGTYAIAAPLNGRIRVETVSLQINLVGTEQAI